MSVFQYLGAGTEANIGNTLFDSVIKKANHCWNFNEVKSLYGIADSVTGQRGIIRQGGAKLMRIGRQPGNSFLILEGNGSSIDLGRFHSCIGDVGYCKRGFTISLWLRFRETDQKPQYFVGNTRPDSVERGFYLLRTANKEMMISYVDQGHRLYLKYPSASNTWTHHLITWNGQRITVYKDGKRLKETTQPRMKRNTAYKRDRKARDISNPMLSLGRRNFKIDADYDDVTFWGTILNETEVTAVYLGKIVDPVVINCEANSSSVCITWSISDDPYTQIQSIHLLYRSNHDRMKAVTTKYTTQQQCISSLGSLTSYNFSVAMRVRNMNKSLHSQPFTCKTTDGIPDPPKMHINERTLTSLEVQWQTPSPANGHITHYFLTVKETEMRTYKLRYELKARERHSTDIGKYLLNITNLQPSTTYTINLKAVSRIGKSRAALITTTTKHFYLKPAKFQATVLGSDNIEVSWTSSDPVVSYRIYLKPRNGREVYVDAYRSPVIIKNLVPFTRYIISFRPRYQWGSTARLAVNLVVSTQDQDECADAGNNNCDVNADCFNIKESYLCQCKSGFVGNGRTCRKMPEGAREEDFCDAETFRNVHWPKMFKGGVAVKRCPNGTIGFASRKCSNSQNNIASVYDLPDLSDCVSQSVSLLGEIVNSLTSNASVVADQMLRVTQTSNHLYGGDVKRIVEYFDLTIQEKLQKPSEVNQTVQVFIGSASNLLNNSMLSAWNDLPKDKRSNSATGLIKGVENLSEKILQQLRSDEKEISLIADNIDLKLQRVDQSTGSLRFSGETHGIRDFPSNDSVVILPIKEIIASRGGKNASVVFYTMANMNEILGDSGETKSKRGIWNVVNSNIVSASIVGVEKITLKKPIILILPHLKNHHTLNTSCVFWNISRHPQSRWLNTGCYVNRTTSNLTVCHCYHLTNFAVLMKVSDFPTETKTVCTVIAALLHYFFTVAFVWMAMEGIMLYFMLKKIFSNRSFFKRKRFMVLCWVLPAVYVILLSSLQTEYYGNKDFCWLSRKNNFIWSFVGPVILVLLINFGVMFHAFRIMCGKRKKDPDAGNFANIWYWLKGCLVLTCLLGVTWIIGVFYIDNNTVVFAYLFTILNALQGLFIFIFHCLIDSRVRREYIRLLKCQKRSEYNEKAGYSSSMKFRKLSASIKSSGSLDRPSINSKNSKSKSESLENSLLKHFPKNDSGIEVGRYTMLRSIPSMKSENGGKANGSVSEREPLVRTSLELTTKLEHNGNGHIGNGLHSYDEKSDNSYESVFVDENEDKTKEGEEQAESRDSYQEDDSCTAGECEDVSDNRKLSINVSSFSSSMERSTLSLASSNAEPAHESIGTIPLHLSLTDSSYHSQSLHSVVSDIISEKVRNSTHSLHLDCLCSTDDLTDKEIELNEDGGESISQDNKVVNKRLVEDEQIRCFLADKQLSISFGKLESISESSSLSLSSVEENSSCDANEAASPLTIPAQGKIEFEVEELPKVEDDDNESQGRRSITPDRKRTETSLRIGIPKLISVSSIDSEPISPIIISIQPYEQEFEVTWLKQVERESSASFLSFRPKLPESQFVVDEDTKKDAKKSEFKKY
eukprot:gene7896-8750_t